MIITNLYENTCFGMNISKPSYKTIEYNLCESNADENATGYGVQIKTYARNFCEEKTINGISEDINLVKKLIKFLYKNCIDVIHFEDIVHDFILVNEEIWK